jgi:hypothetical protein
LILDRTGSRGKSFRSESMFFADDCAGADWPAQLAAESKPAAETRADRTKKSRRRIGDGLGGFMR